MRLLDKGTSISIADVATIDATDPIARRSPASHTLYLEDCCRQPHTTHTIYMIGNGDASHGPVGKITVDSRQTLPPGNAA